MFNIKNKNSKGQKGVSLYIVFLMLTLLLSIALSMSSLLLSEIKMMRQMGKSVIAYYAAETGIERELYKNHEVGTNYSGSIDSASYSVSVVAQGTDGCSFNVNYCVKSVGYYKGVKRAIMISR